MTILRVLLMWVLASPVWANPFDGVAPERVGARLEQPWGMVPVGDDQVLVTLKTKGMVLVDLVSGQHRDVTGVPDFAVVGQGGLLDVAVSQVKDQTVVFACYAKPLANGMATVAVSRSVLTGAQLQNTSEIFQSNHASSGGRHFGCRIAVQGRDLFLSLGDRGDRETAQDASVHAGGVVRMTLDGWLYKGAGENWVEGLHAMGNRNPQGMVVNRATGDLWTHEHGPQGGDEINIIHKGANYGWPRVTFGEEYGGGRIGQGTRGDGYTDPIWVWVPSIAPSGMDFYRGDMFPDLAGTLLVGSLKFESLYVVDIEQGRPVSETPVLKSELGRIRDVHVMPDGAVYLLTDERRGGLYRISK